MTTERERRFTGPRRGQLAFALGFLAISLLLLACIRDQTVWAAKTGLAAQPRFWPAIGLGAMVALGGLHLYRLPWRRFTRFDGAELRRWAAALEYVLWFMAYVVAVPYVGYLPVTMIFVPLLAWRMGYRSGRMLAISVGFAVAVVLVFKMALSVRIPGAVLYEYLPDALRGFFILNL